MLGFDASNYTTDITPSALASLHDQGYGLGIVQAVSPPAPYPPTRTRDQIQVLLDAGWRVDVYIWLWFDLDVSDIHAKLGLLSGFEGRIRKLWLDVEDTAAIKYSQAITEAKVSSALEACDAWMVASSQGLADSNPTGIYSGRWFWFDPRYMANTTVFSKRQLWDANYDGDPHVLTGFNPYGGWVAPALKQFRGTTTIAGIGGVDLDVVTDDINPPAVPARETPEDYPFPDWRESAIAYRGALDQMGQKLQAERDVNTGTEKQLAQQLADTQKFLTSSRSTLAQIHTLSAPPQP